MDEFQTDIDITIIQKIEDKLIQIDSQQIQMERFMQSLKWAWFLTYDWV